MKNINFTFSLLMLFSGIFLNEIFPSILFSQVSQDWVSTYNSPGNGYDVSFSVEVDGSGNVYIAGGNLLASDSNFITIKYNSAGAEQWVNTYLSGHGYAKALTADASGNVYVTGYTAGSGIYDCITIKYNTAGIQQWVKIYNGPGNGLDAGNAITVDITGNVYVTGTSEGSGTGDDCTTIKYNSAGVQQWVSRYNGPGNASDNGKSIMADDIGNVYVSGYGYGTNSDRDYAAIKYNSAGVQQWASRYNGPGNAADLAASLAIDISGNVYVTGNSIGSGTITDYATIKYNSAGVQQWASRYNGPGNQGDGATGIGIDAAGNVYVTGYSFGSGSQNDYATIKYNSAGVQQWAQRYNGPGNAYDNAFALVLDNSGNVYVAGFSSQGGTNEDWATIKYDSSGTQKWLQRYNGTGNIGDEANAIVVDALGNVYVTGYSGGATSYDFTTIKYSQPIGIQQISNTIPEDFSLLQNYPNPFNPTTNIEFSIPKSSFVKLVVYDMTGKEVEILVNQHMTPGTFKADWNAFNYTSGVYFYKLSADNYGHRFSETKKMILIK